MSTRTAARMQVAFLNGGHFVDHLVLLLFPAVAALVLEREWQLSYAQLISLATPGLAAFGFASLLAGWLGDRWSRQGMLLIFFGGVGLGCAAAGLAGSPLQMAAAVFFIGFFASIYHPVGLALLVQRQKRLGASLAINGVFGNIGVASAALIAGWLIEHSHWRMVFIAPGVLCLVLAGLYGLWLLAQPRQAAASPQEGNAVPTAAGAPAAPGHAAQDGQLQGRSAAATQGGAAPATAAEAPVAADAGEAALDWPVFLRGFAVVLAVGACGAMIFQATTLSLPRLFAERLDHGGGALDTLAALAGSWVFAVLLFAALGQLATGLWIDRGRIRHALLVVVGLQVPFLFILAGVQGLPMLALGAVAMFLIFGQVPINDALVARLSQSRWRSRAYAVKYVVSFSVGALAAPLISLTHAWQGFTALYLILALVALAGFLAAFTLPRTVERS